MNGIDEKKIFAVIMAGGAGERLWPLSTEQRPKPLIPLDGDLTLLEGTVQRLFPLLLPDHIFVIADEYSAPAIRSLLPIPPENVVALYSEEIRYELLQQGVGYTLSRRPADDICDKYGLRCIPLKDVYVDIICITNPARPLNEVGNRFLSLLKEEITKSKIQSNFPSA